MSRVTTSLVLAILVLTPAATLAAPGDLDPTFNGTGIVTTPVGGGAQATSVVRQLDGKLVAAGFANVPVGGNPDNLDFAIVRYDHTGMLDPTFGGTGIVTTAVRNGDDQIEAMIQQADGKILVAGHSFDGPSFADSAVTLARYLDDGSLDPTFGGGTGKVVLTPNAEYDLVAALVQQADQKIVVAGSSGNDVLVVRLELDGTPDASFNGTGRVTTTIGEQSSGLALLQQAGDGKLVVAGSSDPDTGTLDDADVALVRYTTGGVPDATFDGDGIVTTPAGSGDAEGRALIQQAGDGKLVVAGVSSNGSDADVALVRYGLSGMVDSGFGTLGVVTTPVGSGDDEAAALAQQDDGRLVVAGWSHNGTNRDVALVRYGTGGTPDAGFGTGGIVTTAVGTKDEEALAVLIQPNGGIVVAGYTRADADNAPSFLVARYLSLTGTTTSSTVTTTTSVPGTTTTLPGVVLVPGGPAAQTANDCYLELQVRDVAPAQVARSQIVSCTDGDPCDRGPCGDRRCDVEVAACALQHDPALPDCMPPTTLEAVKLGGALAASAGQLLAGPACAPATQLQVPVKISRRGVYQRARSRVIVRGTAKAPKGASPRKDKDKWTIQCLPRTTECPP
jgi:uncharacterized delta-60 repeat protein